MAESSDPSDPTSLVPRSRERLMRAKRRELDAHQRAVVMHQEAVAIQRRLGNPRKAVAAQLRADRAQRLHDLALVELAEWGLPATS